MREHENAADPATERQQSTPADSTTPEPTPGHTCRLDPLQVEYLLRALDPRRVKRDGKGFNHLEQHDVRVWLNRIFGVGGWSDETLELSEVATLTTGTKEQPRYTVLYRAQIRLKIKAPCGHWLTSFDDGAIGDATNQRSLGDAHDHALKSALSGALKRACVNLGDQFGVGLYYDDAQPGQAFVQRMLPYVQPPAAAAA